MRWHLPYHNDQEPVDHQFYSLLQQVGIVDIVQFVNQKIGCFSLFTHLISRYTKKDAETKLINACLVALGENIGLYKMADISDVSLQELLTTAHDFIRLETLRPGNDVITNAMAKPPIFKYLNIEEEIIHGSIDGQKIDTQTETINARHSPKFFSLGKGVSSITLIANHIPVNAKIIGTHEHESYFAFDLVYNNTSNVDPVAWRNVNLIGKVEFQEQQKQFNIEEIINSLKQQTDWQQLKTVDETLKKKSHFTFPVR